MGFLRYQIVLGGRGNDVETLMDWEKGWNHHPWLASGDSEHPKGVAG
jgi:hypothetical protein